MTTPTTHQFTKYQRLYDYYNDQLFKGGLPFCLLILSRNMEKVCGHFSKDRWQDREGNSTHEINLNPVYMATATDKNICQTLVHEMVHLWQHEFGKPSRAGYHNKEWAAKMKEVGLMPSHTGKKGGKQTGQQMDDYPIAGGIFEKAFEKMPKDILLPFKSKEFLEELEFLDAVLEGIGTSETGITSEYRPRPQRRPKKKNRIKYSCSSCKANVWGKPNLELLCKTCISEYLLFHKDIDMDILERFTMDAQY